jgi:GNAT superfamily N-acetyltransferase
VKFVDIELARRLETAAHSGLAQEEFEETGKNGNAKISVGGGIATFRGVGSPVTQAEGLGLNGPVSDEEFDRLEDFFRSRGSAVVLEVCPMADTRFIEALGKRGYRVVEFSNVLIREIYPHEKFPAPDPHLTIRPAEASESRVYAETVARGFADHFEVTEEIIGTIQGFFSGPGVHSYLAIVDGKPAGGGTLTLRQGVAGLFGTSVLPGYRKRGIQTAVIFLRLEVARKAGCDLAMSITQPSSGSQRNLERQGFRVVYTRTKFIREWK